MQAKALGNEYSNYKGETLYTWKPTFVGAGSMGQVILLLLEF